MNILHNKTSVLRLCVELCASHCGRVGGVESKVVNKTVTYVFSRRPKLLRAKEIRNNVIFENAVMFFDTLVCSIRPMCNPLFAFW